MTARPCISRRPSRFSLLLWSALALATIADVLTYSREATATVIADEISPLARWLGPGLVPALVTKLVGGILLLTAFWCFRRAHGPYWLEPAIIAFFTVVSFLAAWTNVIVT
jgi:uncharacterized membrane protein YhhN